MNNRQILEAMQHLDPELIQEASMPVQRKKPRLRPILIAACLCLLLSISALAAAGGLLVEFYSGDTMPEHLKDSQLDVYYDVPNSSPLPVEAFSEEARLSAAKQEVGSANYGFESWDATEEFLGLNVFDNPLLEAATPKPVELTDAEGQIILNAPSQVLLVADEEGQLLSVWANYFCLLRPGTFVSVSANAVTDLNSYDSVGSLGVTYPDGEVLQQSGEAYRTPAGAECSIVSTKNSAASDWTVDGWIIVNGFTLRVSLSGQDLTYTQNTVKQILDAFE